jgi:anti-sigma factor RsiW
MTESWDCAETKISLGVYVLGAIDPAERALVDAHLATCRDCRDELAGLAGIPALLARVSPEEIDRIAAEEAGPAAHADEPPSPELLGTVLDLAAERRRRSRWRYAATAAAVVALAGGVFGGLAASRSPAPAPAQAIAFSPGNTSWERVTGTSTTGDISATVDYGAEHWGTVLAAKVDGIPVGTTCVLWAVHPDGTRTQVMSWTTANDEGKVWYWGSLSMPSTNKGITSFQVTAGAKKLVTVQA